MPVDKAYSDNELLCLLKTGDEGAFTEIYNRYWRTLYVTANNILQDHSVAEDIVQEVFVSIWQRRKELNIRSPKAYLQQAIRFRVFKAIKEGRTDADFYSRLSQVSQDVLTENPLLFKELQHLLQSVISSLPEDQQLIFRLNREEDLTYKKIAGKLGISVKTVEKKMSRSLRHIRSGLDDIFLFLITAYPLLAGLT